MNEGNNNPERELICSAAKYPRHAFCKCKGCLWRATVAYAIGQTYQEAAQAAFDLHHCEDYVKAGQAISDYFEQTIPPPSIPQHQIDALVESLLGEEAN